MRKKLRILLILLWILWIVLFSFMASKNGLGTVTPIIAYNRPQGIFGWIFAALILLSATHLIYYCLGNPSNK